MNTRTVYNFLDILDMPRTWQAVASCNALILKVILLIVIICASVMIVASSALCASDSPGMIMPDILANDLKQDELVSPKSSGDVFLRAQVLLDRARFSPGEIDGTFSLNMQKALAAFQFANGLMPSGRVDEATMESLSIDSAPILKQYTITAADVAGPFVPIPKDMIVKSKMQALGYSSPIEELGEMFHASPKLLEKLNQGKNFGKSGEDILVPNIGLFMPLHNASKIIVSKSKSTVTLVDATGKTLAHYPASTGSKHDPLPLGVWKINGVSKNPKFHYNPKLFWDAKPHQHKAILPPGPNNPVGVIWIDLSTEHYGIHGTPEPSTIGKAQSHGCIRLTNWDATALAQEVFYGMPVILQK